MATAEPAIPRWTGLVTRTSWDDVEARVDHLVAERSRRPPKKRRATLRRIGRLWELEVTRGSVTEYRGLLSRVDAGSDIGRVHIAADVRVIDVVRQAVGVTGWVQVGTAWTTEVCEVTLPA
jgi:hypothetical protein